jgi:tetraacyldisaccharide 4'-kinase
MLWLHQLPRHWAQTSAITFLLWPFEFLYTLAWTVRRVLYATGIIQTHKMKATVIVVGNVVAGGGGKTPLTIAMVNRLKQQDYKVGVVSRGFGRTSKEIRSVTDFSTPEQVGDEPLLIFKKCKVPVTVGANRVQAARQLLQENPEINVIVCDDGLQHGSLQRDIEICVMDAMGIGNGHLLPAGPLREPWPRNIDLLLHTQSKSLAEGFESTRTLVTEVVDGHGHTMTLTALQNQPIEVVCGIAKPEAFKAMLLNQGLQIAHFTALPDHDNFQHWRAKNSEIPLICTEKDAVKIWPINPSAYAVGLNFAPEDSFWNAFDLLFKARHRYH